MIHRLGAAAIAAASMVLWGHDAWAARDLCEMLRDKGLLNDKEYVECREAQDKDEAEEKTSPAATATDFKVYWKEGVRFETADKAFQFRIGGRIQNDWAVIAADRPVARELAFSSTQTGTEFRRARLYISGTMYENYEFKMQYDFAGGEAAFKDVYIAATDVPFLQTIKVGQFKEPFSLEELTSSNYITFLERGLPNAMVASRNTGVAVSQSALEENLTWTFGGFRDTDDFGDGFGGDSIYNVSARVTGLPLYEDDGGQLVHLGVSYSHQFRHNDSLRFRERPEAHLSPVRFVDTAAFMSDDVDLIDPEVALVWGPLSLQGEYVHAFVNSSASGNPQFDGFYAYASYFLTGEHRVYKKAEAAFDRVKPKRTFLGKDNGWGAWEVAARISRLDLDAGNVRGGALDDVTAGINWYLNPNLRLMLNYGWAHLESVGDTNIVQGRFQVEL